MRLGMGVVPGSVTVSFLRGAAANVSDRVAPRSAEASSPQGRSAQASKEALGGLPDRDRLTGSPTLSGSNTSGAPGI